MKTRQFLILAGMLMMTSSMTSCTGSSIGTGNAFAYNDRYDDFRDSQTWGKVVTEELPVAAFSGIDLGGCADIDFYQDDDMSVAIIGNEKAVALYEVTVKGDMLTVRMKNGKKANNNVPQVLIEVHAPALWKVKSTGTGDVELKHAVTLEGDLTVTLSGTGDMDADALTCHKLSVKQTGTGDADVESLKCDVLEVASSGTGDTDMDGTVKRADVRVTGTGDADLKLKADEVKVAATGTGDVDLNVKCGRLDINAGGTATVEAKGKCTELVKQSRGLAKVRTKELKVDHLNIEN